MENTAEKENINKLKMSINLSNEEVINEIISSDDFKQKLETISVNYNNLKQENVIRNYILERLNYHFKISVHNHKKAFAEHPREKGSRVDLSIIDCNEIDTPFKIEFKYQFSGDNKNMTDYKRVIEKDFKDRKSDLFILIIAHWNKSDKKEFDNKWGISSNLSRFISNNYEWITGVKKAFEETENSILNEFKNIENAKLIEYEKIKIENPFKIEYYFYVLKRKEYKSTNS